LGALAAITARATLVAAGLLVLMMLVVEVQPAEAALPGKNGQDSLRELYYSQALLGPSLWPREKHEDVFAVLVNEVDLIDVGLVDFSAAVHNILLLIRGADLVQADVTGEPVRTGISVYLVVTISAKHHVIASASVEHVIGLLTEDVVVATFTVDCVILICAYEGVRLVGARYGFG
jgi:hypothetical protein